MKRSAYTQGVKKFIEENKCYWFLDVIDSYQSADMLGEEFQVWNFKKNKTGNGCKIVCDNGDGVILRKQSVRFTDCPQTEFKFWLIKGTIMLPSEY